MNLRDQLLKSGLANKEQARKAQRELAKAQHQKAITIRNKKSDEALTAAEQLRDAQKKADRLYEARLREEREKKEFEARIRDIIKRGEIRDPKADRSYYFLREESRIARITVNEIQAMQLAAGQLAIAFLEGEDRYVLISKLNADKVERYYPNCIVCLHRAADPG